MNGDDRTSKPWPYWMLRFMIQDDSDSFEDLIWSVGGSPPYGGIAYEEAAAVYELLEDFHGAGTAAADKYEAVHKFVKGNVDRSRMLDLFRCYDEIVSVPDAYSRETADRGLAIATKIGDPGAIGLFKLFQAGIHIREGNNGKAASGTVEALGSLLEAAEKDPTSAHRVEQAAQNAVTLTALAGKKARAMELLDELSEVLPSTTTVKLRAWLDQQ